jgi:hypothetical protein
MTYGKRIPRNIRDIIRMACDFAPKGTFEAMVAADALKTFALRFKHPAFRHEDEWRVIIPNPPVATMRFRPGFANVKPYVILTPPTQQRLPLRKVVFGPTLRHDEDLIDSLQLMLEQAGYGGVPVESCGIPFRI